MYMHYIKIEITYKTNMNVLNTDKRIILRYMLTIIRSLKQIGFQSIYDRPPNPFSVLNQMAILFKLFQKAIVSFESK